MSNPIQTISPARLALAFIPVAIVIGVLFKWSVNAKTALYAMGRMLLQLVLIGYVLTFIFDSEQPAIVLGVLSFMLFVAAWIALRPLGKRDARSYGRALLSISIGGVFTLVLVTQDVLMAEPWYKPSVMIPLAGMIFANSMNALSLAAERFQAESERGASYEAARRAALNTALIPLMNTLFAVGLVSLPGMMTGQILSGVPPLIAVRYQIMVMCMLFGAAGISAAVYLVLLEPKPAASR